MNNIFLRYILEFAVIIPGAVFSLLPVQKNLRFRPALVYVIAAAIISFFIPAGSAVCMYYGLRSNAFLMPGLLLFFIPYYLTVTLSFSKKLFLFLQAMLFVGFNTMYGAYLMAPIETDSFLFKTPTGVMVLLINLIIGIIFFQTFSIKLPMLLHTEDLDKIWGWLCIIPTSLLTLVFLLVPQDMSLVMAGRVRPLTLALLTLIPFGILVLYQVIWISVDSITENHRLQQENSLLRMEEKRYEEMRAYMDASRKIRHDSRQHLLVIQDLTEKGDLEQLRDYLDQMTDYNSVTYQTYCGQPSVDAIASYYDRVGKEQKIQFSWTLQLPEKLSMNIADYCSMLGNLVENSVHAVSGLPEPQRRITVVSRMISDQMLGLCVENPYEGTILFDRDGLPRSDEPDHGIGLASVSATVHRYNGTLEITTENYIFSVNILLNLTA